jgi:hypothetical protein
LKFDFEDIIPSYNNDNNGDFIIENVIAKAFKGKYGILNKDFSVLVPFIYDSILRIDYIKNEADKMDTVFSCFQNGKYGIARLNGSYLFESKYGGNLYLMNHTSKNGLYFAENQIIVGKGCNIFSSDGQTLLDESMNCMVEEDRFGNNNFFLIRQIETSKYGVVFCNRKQGIIKPNYVSVSKLSGEYYKNYVKKSQDLFVLRNHKTNNYDYFSDNGTLFFEDTIPK